MLSLLSLQLPQLSALRGGGPGCPLLLWLNFPGLCLFLHHGWGPFSSPWLGTTLPGVEIQPSLLSLSASLSLCFSSFCHVAAELWLWTFVLKSYCLTKQEREGRMQTVPGKETLDPLFLCRAPAAFCELAFLNWLFPFNFSQFQEP